MLAFLDARRLRLIGFALLAAGLIAYSVLWARLALDPAGQFGIDFGDYYGAARRMARGEIPYAPDMLIGSFEVQGLDRYRYPPALAAWLVPLTALPLAAAKWVWFIAQFAALAAALVYVARRAGVAGWRDQVLVAGLAFVAFGPVFDALHKGNVSGLLAAAAGVALVAPAGTAAAAATLGALSKLTPGAWLLPLLTAAPRRTLAAGAFAALLFVAPSLLAFDAWLSYPAVLGNMLAGSADYPSNLALGYQLGNFMSEPLARGIALVVAAAFGAAALLAARRPGGLPAALTAAVMVSLLVPGTMWWHYTAVLLPSILLALLRRPEWRWRLALPVAAAPAAWGGSAVGAAAAIPLLGVITIMALWPPHEVTS